MDNTNIFTQYLFEAPGDDESPPDTSMSDASTSSDEAPEGPDGIDLNNPSEDSAPDIDGFDDSAPDGGGDNSAPDIDGFDDNMDDGFGDENSDDDNNGQPKEDLHLDDKVSAIMNMNLYQRYLSLLTSLKEQISSIKDNYDILRTLSPDALDIVDSLKKLEENINLYIKNNFVHENYSKNLLFFNKCLNLLKLLNDIFEKNVTKGIKNGNNSNN